VFLFFIPAAAAVVPLRAVLPGLQLVLDCADCTLTALYFVLCSDRVHCVHALCGVWDNSRLGAGCIWGFCARMCECMFDSKTG
jgi:hypothetical protein